MSESIYSHIQLCASLGFSQGKIRSTQSSEKSKFLSSLALLLNGDASCTSIYVDLVKKVVLIARNDLISSHDRRYFDQFFTSIRVYANLCFEQDKKKSPDDIYDLLRSIILAYNSKKILKRFKSPKSVIVGQLRKIVDSIEMKQMMFIDELRTNRKVYTDNPKTTEKLHLIRAHRTEEDYIQFLVNLIRRFLSSYDRLIENSTNPTDQHLFEATSTAVHLYQSRFFYFILNSIDTRNNDQCILYFEKISAHMRSLNLILKCLLRQRAHLAEIYQQITWQLILPAVKEIAVIHPKTTFEKLFDHLLSSSSLSVQSAETSLVESKENFYQKYLSQMEIFSQNPYLLIHQHAEILLIDHLLKNSISPSNRSEDVEIGISKLPCLLCSFYINELNNKYHRCFYSSGVTNGKIYGKWSLREDEDSSIIHTIEKKLIEILKNELKKRLTDQQRSGTKKSGDSDIMFTSIEEEEFDLTFSRRTLSS